MHGLPEQAFDMLVTLLARICDDPDDPCPARRPECRDGGSRTSATSDSSYSRWTKPLVWSAFSISYGQADTEAPERAARLSSDTHLNRISTIRSCMICGCHEAG
jgi:hypothetical protein